MANRPGVYYEIDGDALFRSLNRSAQTQAILYRRATRVVSEARRLDAQTGNNHGYQIVKDALPNGRTVLRIAYDTDDTPKDERVARRTLNQAIRKTK